MQHVRAVPLHEADERFALRSLFHLGKQDDDAEVVVFTGDTALENLPLDFSHLDSWSGLTKTHPDMFVGVVVDGDLAVTDWVTNWEWDFGPFLLVRGDLRAKNLATAGSEVLVQGDLHVTQTVAGVYNHGHTVIRGDTRAEVVLTQEHLTEFHGRLHAELGIAGNFLRIVDPATTQVNGWAGYVCDLEGRILSGVGARSTRALRALDPDFWDLDSRKILRAMEAGRSLLRPPGPPRTGPGAPEDPAEAIRDVLRLARCQEHDPWDDGFVVHAGEADGPVEVYFCEADEADEGDEGDEGGGGDGGGEPNAPGALQVLDPAAELARYAEALAAAGYRVTVDPHDEDVLQIRP
ncbi:hypothetical protein OG562_00260 [Streptomyces sp. NBC_01275]|uniref:hypothetical protein n=1 Tax=Streptomyces sp. NBC_01275 TaxID=2903807 RepID=UPI002255F05B|nr:hypothetical protein [Streptomyces sp. NBC_01275]MCX4759449.1 hypothetical protein [Streptomyces sp. NBC_01275]